MMKKNYEFRNVLTKGTCFSGKNLLAFIQKNRQQPFNFLGLAISVKICKAVKRNYLKRLIRESYSFYEEQLKTGNQIVFLWKKKADPQNVQFQDIKKDVESIFMQAKILKNKE